MSRLLGKSSLHLPGPFPRPIVDAVAAAVGETMSSFLGSAPTAVSSDDSLTREQSIIGTISFEGPTKWSLSLLLPRTTAIELVEQFCAVRLDFDDPDMGDAVGELVNVLAGFVTEQLDKRGIATRMSLPTMIRGEALEFVTERLQSSCRLAYRTGVGSFTLHLSSGGTSSYMRLPGK
jgi:CheY-specific phosphatase CheX